MTTWMNDLLMTLAMMGPPPNQKGGAGDSGVIIGYMVLIFAIFFFLVIRPQQKKEKDRKAMVSAVKTGDRVIFSGGLLGAVTNVKEHTIIIKVADGVKIEALRGAVSRVLKEEEKISGQEENA